MRAAVVALLLVGSVARAQAVFAYLPFKMQSSASQPFGWYLDSRFSNPAGLNLSQVQASAEAAWTSWNNVACALPKTNFLGLTGSTVPNPTDAYDIYSTMAIWATSQNDTHYQQYLYGIPDIMAMSMPLGYAGVLQTCDVYVNAVNFQWSVASPTASGVMDLQSVLTHEFGHCLGLDHHFFDQADVMQASINKGQQRRALSPADVGSLCNRYPLAGAVGSPCLADGGCTAAQSKCLTQPMGSGSKTFCTVGCATGTGFVCDLPLDCRAAAAFNPTFSGACLMPDGTETRVGAACTDLTQCGSPVGVCQQPFQGVSGTTFWQNGYCMQNCGPGRGLCPGGSKCTTLSAGNDFCLSQCRVGLGDCRPGYSCALTSQGGVCVPECLTDTDCGDVNVWACRTCDGLCVEKQNAAAQVGDVCTDGAQCGAGQVCAQFSSTSALSICTQTCSRGCGTCPTGSACHPVGLLQELYCLRSCSYGTCAQGEQCAQLPTGRGCMPGCRVNSECPVGTECNYGECVLLGGDDSGCPFCPAGDDGGGNAPRRDGGTGGGGGGTCSCAGALGPVQTSMAVALVLYLLMRRRAWPRV